MTMKRFLWVRKEQPEYSISEGSQGFLLLDQLCEESGERQLAGLGRFPGSPAYTSPMANSVCSLLFTFP